MLMSNTLLLERVIKRKGKHSGNGVKNKRSKQRMIQSGPLKTQRKRGSVGEVRNQPGAQRSRRLAKSMKIIH